MMSKPRYIVILTGLFCSVVTGVLRTFTRFFRGLSFWYDNYGLWPWQAKPRPKIISFGYFALEDVVNLGWSGGAMVLGKLPVPGRPTYLE